MKLFYAYLKNADDDLYSRYLITFVDREVADKWWRAISTPPSPFAGNIERTSPQFYTHHATTQMDVAANFFIQPAFPDAKQFLKKMFFTLLTQRDSQYQTLPMEIIPSTEITDHISGGWYSIRSKLDPRRHWYFRIDGVCLVCGDADCDTIHVSTEHCTSFCIRAHNQANQTNQGSDAPKDFVMIGSDEISIMASKEYTLYINDAEELKATKIQGGMSGLLFSDLKNRFVTRAERQEYSGAVCEYVVPVERGYGRVWELVD